MYNFFNIGEIANFFQIPKSKLRYWEKEGLVKLVRNNNNDYREYSIKSISQVANIMFYRSLNISIKELKKLSQMTLTDLENILGKTEKKIDAQIEELNAIQARIEVKKQALAKIKAYEETPYVMGEIDFNAAVEFSLCDRKHLSNCIDDSENFAVIMKPGQKTEYFHCVLQDAPLDGEKVV